MFFLDSKKMLFMSFVILFFIACCVISFSPKMAVWAANEKQLSESAQEGKRLFDEVNCLMCHLLNGKGGGLDKAPDFAGVSKRKKSDEMQTWLKKHLYEEPRISMFEEDPTDEDISHIIDYLQTL